MKTKILIIIGCTLFMVLNGIAAQNTQKIEKSINGETYIIKNYWVKNKKNGTISRKYCKQYSSLGKFSMEDVIRKSFSEARRKELSESGVRILIGYICKASGEIVEVSFSVSGGSIDILSLSEIYLLEKNLLGKKFKVRNSCPDDTYFRAFGGHNI